MKGSYILLIELNSDSEIEVGGEEKHLDKGFYTYFGSAFGPGGLKRIDRHKEVSKGKRDVRHWHIDYLSGLEDSNIIEAIKFPEKDLECELAQEAGQKVENFGSTDCSCRSHLGYFPDRDTADKFIESLRSDYLDS